METKSPITTAFEPCGAFVADDGTPVCMECGWLDIEHSEPVAEVRAELAA